jgi:hypothetical protein
MKLTRSQVFFFLAVAVSVLSAIASCIYAYGAYVEAKVAKAAAVEAAAEKPYLSYPQLPFPVEVRSVKRGDIIPIDIVRCNSDSVAHSYSVSRALRNVDGSNRLVPMESIYSLIPPGCHKAMPSPVHRVPLCTPLGRYQFFGGAIVQGKTHPFEVTFMSAEFDVIEGDKKCELAS